MRNRMYGGVRGRKTKVGEKLLRFPPTRFFIPLSTFFPKTLEVTRKSRIFAAALKITLKVKQYGCSYK